MGNIQIIGISLVKNEDVFIERAVNNVLEFCDRLIIVDNGSTDKTKLLARRLEERNSKIEYRRIYKTSLSQRVIEQYVGTATWIFGVDGDEIYDPVGLKQMREDILNGRHQKWWQIFGNVLNCVRIDYQEKTATGYLSPPCRSMTKLFNFGAIKRWDGYCKERLHGGKPIFQVGYSPSLRYELHKQLSWDKSHFRCLHVCFLRRSSRDLKYATERRNIMEKGAEGMIEKLKIRRLLGCRGKIEKSYKREKYMRGEKRTFDASSFVL